MTEKKQTGCREYDRLSRRNFIGLLGGSLGATMTAAAVPAWVPRVVLAQDESSSRDVLIHIFLRGGADGLSLVVPHGDDDYYNLRPGLAVPRPDSGGAGKALDLDGFFGLPPAFSPLMEAYQDSRLLLVHACGLEGTTRSHFEAMHFMEVGTGNPAPSLFSGWLGRHLEVTAPTFESAVLRAAAISDHLPRVLVGGPQTLPVGADPDTFGLAGDTETLELRREALARMNKFAPIALRRSSETTFATLDLLQAIDFAGYQPAGGAEYPEGEFGQAMKSAAALIKAEVGVEALAVDVGGWDTHEQQGPVDGFLSQLMGGFASALAAFHTDLETAGVTNVTTVAMSEFGRNAFENGSAGTDHGHGGAMLVLGHGVRGGQVHAQWPGLAPERLYEGQDLAITTDYRDVLTEILTKRVGNADHASVFPDPSYQPVDHSLMTRGA